MPLILLSSLAGWLLFIAAGIIGVFLLAAAAVIYRSHQAKKSSAMVSPVGAEGVAITDLSPSGSVLVDGTLWPGYTENGGPIARGARISVVGGRLTELGLRVLQKS